MAFKTSQSLGVQYDRLKQFVASLKRQAQRHVSDTTSMTVIVDELLPLLVSAANELASVPGGLAAYAIEQENDQNYDVVAEFTAVRDAVINVKNWLVSNLPSSGGYLQDRTLNADGTITDRQLTAGEKSALTTQLNTIINAIE